MEKKYKSFNKLLLVMMLLVGTFINAQGFVTEWKHLSNDEITIPINPNFTYDYDVDWGDGSSDLSLTGDATHTYTDNYDFHIITIKRTFPAIFFNNTSDDRVKIVSVKNWGNGEWKSMEGAFDGCVNLKVLANDLPNIPINGNVSFARMFKGCEKLTTLTADWSIAMKGVINTNAMFEGAIAFNQEIKYWHVSNVNTMSGMFKGASAFNQDISSWDVSSVTDMSSMFFGAIAFDSPLEWDVQKVTNMSSMFRDCENFNQSINDWVVGGVKDMSSMFTQAILFNKPLDKWDVRNVKNMREMFWAAYAFDQDISAWDPFAVLHLNFMFHMGSGLSRENYDKLLFSWSGKALKPGLDFDAGNSYYCAAKVARANLTKPTSVGGKGWVITDSGPDCLKVVEYLPADDAEDVPLDQKFTFKFDREVNLISLGSTHIIETGSLSPKIDCNVKLLIDKMTVELTPARSLKVGEEYHIVIPAGICEDFNYSLDSSVAISDPTTWNFKATATQSSGLSFNAIFNKTYGDANFTLSGSKNVNNTNPIKFSVSSNQPADAGEVELYGANNEVVRMVKAGKVKLSASIAANGSYNAEVVDFTFEIKKREITIKAKPQEKTYGDPDPDVFTLSDTYQPYTFEGTLTPSLGVTGAPLKGTLERARVGLKESETAKTHNNVILIGNLESKNENYTINFIEGDFTILPAALTVTATSTKKIFEDPDPSVLGYTTSPSLSDADIAILESSGGLTRETGEAVGQYNILLGGLSHPNFAITYVPAIFKIVTLPEVTSSVPLNDALVSLSDNLSITFDKPQMIKGNNGKLEIFKSDGTSHGVFNFSGPTPEITIDNAPTGATVTINPTTDFAPDEKYYVRIDAEVFKDDDENFYKGISDDTTWTFKTRLNPELSFAAAAVTKIYGKTDSDFELIASHLGEGVVSYEVVSAGTTGEVTLTPTATGTKVSMLKVGLVNIKAVISANGDYSSGTTNVVLKITPRPITISAIPKAKAPGGSEPELTYEITAGNIEPGDTLSGELIREPGEAEGALYEIKKHTLAINDNYDITFIPANLIITITPIIVKTLPANGATYVSTVDDFEILFDKNIFKGTGNITIYKSDGTIHETIAVDDIGVVINGPKVEIDPVKYLEADTTYYIQIDNTAFKDVDGNEFLGINDAITWKFSTKENPLLQFENFEITYGFTNSGTFDLVKVLSPDWNEYVPERQGGKSAVSDGTISYEIVSDGSGYEPIMLNGDDFSEVTMEGAGVVKVRAIIQESTKIMINGVLTSKYAFGTKDILLTIKPKKVSVTADASQMKYYGEFDPELTFVPELWGFVYGDEYELEGTLGRVEGEDIGTYEINIGSLAHPGYEITAVPGELFEIKKQEVTIEANWTEKVYGEDDPELIFTLVSGYLDEEDLTGEMIREPGEDAGDYTISQGTLDNPNYDITFIESVFKISKASQLITWEQDIASIGCDGSEITLTATSTGLPIVYTSSDEEVVTTNDGVLEILKRGSGTVTAGHPGNENYLPAIGVVKDFHVVLDNQLRQYYDNNLFFNNTSKEFVKWEWFKDGLPVLDEKSQFYKENQPLNGVYYVKATDVYGNVFETCPVTIESSVARDKELNLSPNPTDKGGSFKVQSGYTAEELVGAKIIIINMAGQVVSQIENVSQENDIASPNSSGIYIVKLQLQNGVYETKNLLVK